METTNKLLEFQKKIQAIKKDGKNPHFKSSYATLPQILSEVKPILSELGLTLLQPILANSVHSVIYEGDKPIAESSIKLPEGLNPQQMGSAITYFRRYTLASLLALEIEDDDGNAASQKPTLKQGTHEFGEAVKYLSTKPGANIIKIEEKYHVSPEVKQALLDAVS